MTEEKQEKEVLDLRGEVCPMNFTKIILKIEEIQSENKKRILEAIIDESFCGDIVKSIKNYGYKIVYAQQEGAYYRIGIEVE
ncbi:sulfurtransferase TusA family protein [Candidatus Pacearchaeota archaeon]|nr:sulfurtransferase TusA family protein [Candidatus Pacearchaeota archaeon]